MSQTKKACENLTKVIMLSLSITGNMSVATVKIKYRDDGAQPVNQVAGVLSS